MNGRMYPLLITVLIGQNVVLECDSQGNTMWFFGKGDKPFSMYLLQRHRSIIKIQEVTFENNGKYYCYGQISKNSNAKFLVVARVNVIGKN